MKYLFLVLLSFNCLAQEVTNECGQTREQWTFDTIRCLTVIGNEVVESHFDLETKELELSYNVMTLEELEEQWERVE
jgi:hypothetical protein